MDFPKIGPRHFSPDRLRRLKLWGLKTQRWFWHRRGSIGRGGIALSIGLALLGPSDFESFDVRLQIRGNQNQSQQIVLVTLSAAEMANRSRLAHPEILGLRVLPESGDLTDSFFWERKTWLSLLETLLAEDPKAIGVTFFFSEGLRPTKWSAEEEKIFWDPRIIWAGLISSAQGLILPAAAHTDKEGRFNVATAEFLRDQDGVIRRFETHNPDGPEILTIPVRLAGVTTELANLTPINYRGDARSYAEVSVSDVLAHNYPDDFFQNKIVLIGPESRASSQYLTPLGASTRHGVLAAMTDHLLSHRSIHRFSFFWNFCLLILTLIFALQLIAKLPQKITLAFFILATTLWCALSTWIFDATFFWLPVTGVLSCGWSAYFIFLGSQANRIEQQHFRLKQEQASFFELEQLKNNFVSLISHDLKTPIAKIQAILDRLNLKTWDPQMLADLEALRRSNDELNQYIQSVLRMLRVESREFRLNLELGVITDLIQDAWLQLAPLATAKNLQVQLQLEPLFASEFDHTLIREVIVNLLDNAIKYTPANGSILVVAEEHDEFIWIFFQDTGPGISPEDLPRIWGKFVRGKDQELKSKGSGLGLYLVKFFIELHGGKVFAESEIGRGTKIGFALPLSDS